MPDNGKLIQLARYLMGPDSSLVDEIELAINKPHDYVGRFAKRLHLRGIRQPHNMLPWIALVDGLLERGQLEEIDWKGSPEEVQAALRRITGQQREWAWLWDEDPEGRFLRPPRELFPRINEQLDNEGRMLMVIDIGSDSYPLIVLAHDRMIEASQLARLAGYGRIIPAVAA